MKKVREKVSLRDQFTSVEKDDKGSSNSTASANLPVGGRDSILTTCPSQAMVTG